jgi:deaminated glutathione amidase
MATSQGDRRVVRVAMVQLNSRDDKAANVAAAEAGIVRAAEAGAKLIALPELWTYLGPPQGNRANAEPIPGPVTERLGALARAHEVVLHGGSMLELPSGAAAEAKPYNTAVLFDGRGSLVATYRKIHLFDAQPRDGDEPYHESATTAAGDEIVTAEIEGLRLGLATCYDLRFPELFRALALRGASILLLPSAFTLQTGRDHWEPLLRARAIENACYVIAAAQVGTHPPQRTTFGRSMVVDPWGTVLAQAPDEPTVVVTDIDLARVADVRRRIPSLANRRPDVYAATPELAAAPSWHTAALAKGR